MNPHESTARPLTAAARRIRQETLAKNVERLFGSAPDLGPEPDPVDGVPGTDS